MGRMDPELLRRATGALITAGYLPASDAVASPAVIIEAARRYEQDSGMEILRPRGLREQLLGSPRSGSPIPDLQRPGDRGEGGGGEWEGGRRTGTTQGPEETRDPRDEIERQISDIIFALTPRYCAPPGTGPYQAPSGRWGRGALTWSLDLRRAASSLDYRGLLGAAFNRWSAAEPFFSFRQATSVADIRCWFEDLQGRMDASGGRPGSGQIIFDPVRVSNEGGFVSTAMHEIGHNLGLKHARGVAVMNPLAATHKQLHPLDVQVVRGIYGWQPQRRLADRGSSDGPALASLVGAGHWAGTATAFMAWKGIDGSNQIWLSSSNDGMQWGPQVPISGARSSHGPSLTRWYPGDRSWPGLFLAWKGEGGDQRLYWARSHPDLSGFEPHNRFDDRASAARPGLAWFDDRVVMAWRGSGDDTRLWWSSFDRQRWSAQAPIPGCLSDHAPALAALGTRLYLIWKGLDRDPIHYAFLDRGPDGTWSAPAKVEHPWIEADESGLFTVSTPHHPAATTCGAAIILAFQGWDDRLWFMPFRSGAWSGPTQLPDLRSSTGPGITSLGGNPVMAWKAQWPDQNLYCSSLARP